MDEPIVSVLMTAYNREQYIAEAIESVLHSGYENFELIIVDDCSVDNTLSIIQGYERQDSRVKVYRNEKNLGDYPNRNKAATYARGKYLKYVDSDDKLLPGGLRYCVELMEDHPDADWGILFPGELSHEHVLSPRGAIEFHFFRDPFLKVGPGGTILNRHYFNKIGTFPVLYGPANDMYFNLLAASKGNVLLLKDIFLYYRIHEGQEQNNAYSYLYNNCRFLKDAFRDLNLHLDAKELQWLQLKRKRRFAVNITRYFLQTRNVSKTKEAFRRAEFSFRDFMTGIFHISRSPERNAQYRKNV
jgi:glycosyltransferase involved in cell wall biosynthesis